MNLKTDRYLQNVSDEKLYLENIYIFTQIKMIKNYLINNHLRKKMVVNLQHDVLLVENNLYFIEIGLNRILRPYVKSFISKNSYAKIFIVKIKRTKKTNSIDIKDITNNIENLPNEYCSRKKIIKENYENRISVSIFLNEKTRTNLYKNNIRYLDEIDDYSYEKVLSNKDRIQYDCILQSKIYQDEIEISNFFSKLVFPLYILDFECYHEFSFESNKKEPIPFLFYLIKVDENYNIEKEVHFMADEDKLLQELCFAKHLLKEIGHEGSIIVYDKGLEKKILNLLLSKYKNIKSDLNLILDRIIDLQSIFKNLHYYDYRQKEKTNLKKIINILTDDNYENLLVKNGELASTLYFLLKHHALDQKDFYSDELIRYCKKDVVSTYNILLYLQNLL